uniref:Uncharacterized protein n=2 Tax=Helicotheca tamesis TaxID=374047 RepID=A0A7S2GZP7_9STRA|mmetsp:Transcript_13796/g.18883  ORF Transcript_13796/g.18883 Transcript_13796/m.18883 type:complete len:319 (+) Transcript_13796:258-1214(+)|eukprot:CAMPEP_0185728976 /NCGR_PEP_ID=MMETSP1171-20130828/4401_1 /TAXON_ID=374046 /ORGANISM="Helicotheca tamensis, Strain CCMP826" /LENGTH=318 /DNA_ID=CAMNT_0028397739 /DNA_START=179 /DNA_END=1135 /DNA_ORIENTATION=-
MKPTVQIACLSACFIFSLVDAFTAPPTVIHSSSRSALFRPNASPTSLQMAAAAASPGNKKTSIPDLLSKLPWNAEREKQREARRLKLESAKLHRELGIAPDATFEEITEATEILMSRVGNDVKKRVKIEIAKDKIMQIRLNERLAGLGTETKEARTRTSLEEGDYEDDLDDRPPPKAVDEPAKTTFLNGLIVKPDLAWRNKQLKVWGIITLFGAVLPPMCPKIGMANWLIMAGQLSRRGVPDSGESAGMFGGRNKTPGAPKALGLSVTVWVFAKIFAIWFTSSIPGLRMTNNGNLIELAIENTFLGFATAYMQTYKPV